MKTLPHGSRDELDSLIARHVRSQRRMTVGRPLPAPLADEPQDQELLALLEGRLSPAETQALEARLESHPYSRDRLEILREALEEGARGASSGSGAPEVGDLDVEVEAASAGADAQPLARLVFAIRRGADQVLTYVRGSDTPLTLAPAAVATRSAQDEGDGKGDALYRFARRFGNCDATIHVERLPGRGVDLRVELSADGAPVTDARASLRRAGKLLESVRIREGLADFADLEPAETYEMEIKREGSTLGELCLSFLAV